jgi:hypothetical protein
LFIPKIQAIDKRMLLTNLGSIVEKRKDGLDPEDTLQEQEFYNDIIYEYGKTKCDKEPMKDILIRYKVQIALWKSVHNLREGIYFDVENTMLEKELRHCKDIDVPDILGAGDSGDMLRKLFVTFAFSPIVVLRSNYLGDYLSKNMFQQQYRSTELLNGDVESLQMISIFDLPQQGLLGNQQTTQDQIKPVHLQSKIDENNIYWDPEAEIIVPRVSKILTTRGVLVFNIQRRFTPFEQILNFNQTLRIKELPLVNRQREQINPWPVVVSNQINVARENKSYQLTSAVLYKVLSDGTNNINTKFYQAGFKTIINSYDGEKIEYDPIRASKYQANSADDISSHLTSVNKFDKETRGDFLYRYYSAAHLAEDSSSSSTVEVQLAVYSNLVVYVPPEEREPFQNY